jgi:hypothetical protein
MRQLLQDKAIQPGLGFKIRLCERAFLLVARQELLSRNSPFPALDLQEHIQKFRKGAGKSLQALQCGLFPSR